MTSWQGQRIDTTSTHGTGCTLASAIACFLGRRATAWPIAVDRAREFVRVALHAAPGLGQGAGPVGQANVRLDVGAGPRLNQVTVTVTDYAKSVAFLSRARPQADRRQPGEPLRPVRDRGRRDLVDPDRSGREDRRRPPPSISNATTSTRRSTAGARGHPVRAWPAQPAVDVARGAPARSRRATSSSSTRRAKRAASRRGGSN